MENILTSLIDDKRVAGAGSRIAVTFRHSGTRDWIPYSWDTMAAGRDALAAALFTRGVSAGQAIGIFSANRPEILVTDFAAYALRGIPVSIYATSTAEQVEYICRDAGIRILFVGDRRQLDAAIEVKSRLASLETIVTYEDSLASEPGIVSFSSILDEGKAIYPDVMDDIRKITESAVPEDTCTLIYTSGTTGEPKGAVLTHSNLNAAIDLHDRRLTMLSDKDTSLCFLPLSHIFEKAWTYYCLHLGIVVNINHDPKEITTSLREIRPSCMCSVPRFWEKAYTLIQDKMSRQKGLLRLLVALALKTGRRRNLGYARLGKKAPWWLELPYKFFDKRIFSGVRKVMGIENGNIFPTAGAPLSDNINSFFHAIGVNLVVGYGLSETTATVTCYPQTGWEINSVGTPLEDIRVRIGKNNEIEISGPTVMKGYFNKPEQTAEAFTEDGWFRTGDAGEIDSTGALVITDRLKDLFKTSNGKYIAPQALESRLGEDPYIEQVAVIGDRRKYVTALIIPAFETLKEYAVRHRISFNGIEDLLSKSEIKKFIEERIEKLQKGLAGFEKVKKFTLIPRELTMESGELTNTLKMRRKVINDHFAKEIEAMYA